jgi:hypothetical protein
MRFQILAARLALAALLLAVAAAATAVMGVRAGLIAYQSGLTLMVPAVAMGLIALVCALAWLFTALRRNRGEGRRIGLTAFLGALLFLWPPLHSFYTGLTSAPVNDVTSDPDDPPQFVVLAKRAPGMNSPVFDSSSQVSFRGERGAPGYILHVFYYSWLTKPHAALAATASKWFWRDFETAKRMGWNIAGYDEKAGRIEATASSFWFGQVTDIVIRVRPAGTQGARVDVRAQSENGKQDFGRNLALLKDFFSALNP